MDSVGARFNRHTHTHTFIVIFIYMFLQQAPLTDDCRMLYEPSTSFELLPQTRENRYETACHNYTTRDYYYSIYLFEVCYYLEHGYCHITMHVHDYHQAFKMH